MSNKSTAKAARHDRAEAERDKAHWKGQLSRLTSGRSPYRDTATSRATFQRGIDDAQARIDAADAKLSK